MNNDFKETPLGVLPNEWDIVHLGDIFTLKQGKSLSAKNQSGRNPRPFLRTSNVFWGRIDLSVLDKMDFSESEAVELTLLPGDLLVCEGGDIGRTAMWEGQINDCYYQNHLHRLRKNSDKIHSPFYMYWLQAAFTLLDLYGGEGNKTTIPNLSQGRLKAFLVPFPSLPEQRAIAHVLTTVRQSIEATERVISASRELKRSLMKYLFTYGPVPTDKADQVPLKETEIGEIPEDWMSLRIGEFAETTSGGTPSRERQDYYQGDIPWVKSGELGDSHIVITEETITDKALVNSNAKIFPIGTLLLAMYGATAGKVGILEIEAATNQAVCAIFPNEKALSTYLFYSLMYRREELLGERYGGAQPNVSQRVIRLFKLPIPPIDIQTVIYLSLNNIDNKLSAETRRKSALKALFNSLLHYLMTGKLRVQI